MVSLERFRGVVRQQLLNLPLRGLPACEILPNGKLELLSATRRCQRQKWVGRK